MYYINEKLIRSVSKLFGMTRKEFSTFAMDSEQLYGQRMTLWSRLTVNDIIKISNATHIPMRHFFVKSEKGYAPYKKEEITFKGEWKDVSINIPFIEYVYNHRDIYSHEDLKRSTGNTEMAFYNWFRSQSCNMKAQTACDFCNYFGCDLKNIINDPNEELPSIDIQKESPNKIENQSALAVEDNQMDYEKAVRTIMRQMSNLSDELSQIKEEMVITNAQLKVITMRTQKLIEHNADAE